MNAARAKGGGAGESVPSTPQTAPQAGYGQHGHDFTLQAVMELQKSVGEMNATMLALKGSVDSVKGKVDDLVAWKHKILGGVAVLTAVIALLGFVAGKASDYMSFKVPVATQPTATPVMPAPASIPAHPQAKP